MREEAAIVLDEGKEYLAESRLGPLARREGIGSIHELVRRLQADRDGELQRKVIEAMTTNETSFFRDKHPFDVFKSVLLPEIVAHARERQLDIWCAAASTGQEPYSVAMLLRETPELADWTIRLIATDISEEVLERGRRGRFTQLEVNRGLPAALLVKYFTRSGIDWQIGDDLRRMVEFRQLNLAGPWPSFRKMDVVFMRNVLIYFDVATKREILGRARAVLKPDGSLFLGGAETTLNLDDGYERVQLDKAGLYRVRR